MCPRHLSGMAIAVIGCTFLRVGQHLVGFAALFEFFFAFGIARIAVGSYCIGELAISQSSALVVRIAGYA